MKKRIISLIAAAVTAMAAVPSTAGALYRPYFGSSPELDAYLEDYTRMDSHDGNTDPYTGFYAHKYWTDKLLKVDSFHPYVCIYYIDDLDKDALEALIKKHFPECNVSHRNGSGVMWNKLGITDERNKSYSSYGLSNDDVNDIDVRLRQLCEEAADVGEILKCIYTPVRYDVNTLWGGGTSPLDYTTTADKRDTLLSYVEEKGFDVTVSVSESKKDHFNVKLTPNGIYTRQEEFEICKQIRDDTGIIPEYFIEESVGSGTSFMEDPLETGTNTDGDANCDRKLTIADATAVMQAVGNPDKYALSSQGKFNADIYGNDGITGMDALAIMRRIIGLPEETLNDIDVPEVFRLAAETTGGKAEKGEVTGYWSAADKYGVYRYIEDFNGNSYEVRGKKFEVKREQIVPEKYLGEVIGEAAVESPMNFVYPIFDGEQTDDTTYVMAEPVHISEVREIKGISPKVIIAVKYDFSDDYVLFTNKNYSAGSLEEYAEDLGVRTYANIEGVYCGPTWGSTHYYTGVSLDFLYENLLNDSQFTDRTIPRVDSYTYSIHIYLNYPEDLGFSPSIHASKVGWAEVSIPDIRTRSVKIGEAGILAFMEKIDETYDYVTDAS